LDLDSLATIQITDIGVEEAGRIYVVPAEGDFAFIHRAAMGVSWDAERRRLLGSPPKEWSHGQWFEQIVTAVESEYRDSLRVASSTRWTNIPEQLRQEIQSRFQ
jgi:hypothetical protein